ncbi:benzoate/H(+) symporter BenE family transporter [Klebsiella pneumoniae]|uniref:Benzoate/H(+) symporter BenE family transporter n=1 Tax=Klebsiella pneumoniae TaxID=573 RepID=A0AAW9UPE4_KLEPN|nr:benzoate/H(+) symporter BenE family transporter [Klebsiella pneumoniae]MSS29304.1 benzoate/H(+) symporter BenE family transporter [Klebsiella pneumoniae]QBE74493.1 benzoate transporter BenE [Klebsiella pneumoniae]QBG00176.1 benzoate transporter BenE [Klebsiella pneumoniae]
MRSFSLPLPTLFAGFVAVLVGYASSAAIIWQAAAAAGATPGQIAGWMTALGLAMGISTLALSAWRKVPVLTAWSTPGAALLVSGLQGVTLAEAVGIFIFANALIVICGATGLFARLMQIIPHSLAAAMLAGILLRFGLQAFAGLQDHLPLCGGMLAAWLLCKALWPRFAVVAALVIGALIAAASGDVASAAVPLAFVTPEWVAPQFTPALLLSVGLPFFLVTMASQNAPGFATLQASGYTVPVSALIVVCGGSITALMSALPPAWIQMLAGLALLGTIGGSLFQAVHQASERDAAVLTFLVTASGVTLAGIGSAFWGVVLGGVSYGVLSALRRP